MLDKPQDRLKRLTSRPNETELQSFMQEALSQAPVKFHYSWKEMSGENYLMLSVYSQGQAGVGHALCHWRLFNTCGPEAKEIWSHITFDAAQISRFITEAVDRLILETTDDNINTRSSKSSKPLAQTAIEAAPQSEKKPAAAKIRKSQQQSQADTLATTFDNLAVQKDQSLLAPDEFFKGNLKLVNLSTLLQSISLGRLSGRLRVQRNPIWADLYFVQGAPVHAEGTRGIGEDCLLQVICWKEGEFHFEPKIKTDEKTINRSLESLILEGALLTDHTDFLKDSGVRLTSVLFRPNPDLSEADFDRITANERLDIQLLKKAYLSVDGRRNLEDVVDSLGLVRSQWVPLFASLVRLELVDIAALHSQIELPNAKPIDLSQAELARQLLLSKETGLYTYGAFLFLLSEQIKFRGETPITLMIMDIQPSKFTLGPFKALDPALLGEVGRTIESMSAFTGIIGHYENDDLAILLPGLRSEKAAKIAERILQAVSSPDLVSRDAGDLWISIGVASLPDDARDISTLLGEAEKAKDRARTTRAGIWLAKTPTLS